MATYSVQLNPVTMAFEVVDETNTVIESFQSVLSADAYVEALDDLNEAITELHGAPIPFLSDF